MIYVIRDPDGTIITYGQGDGSDNVLLPGQEISLHNETLEDYALRLKMVADKDRIVADGMDVSTITISTTLDVESVDIYVNEIEDTIPLVDGVGYVEIEAETPGVIIVAPVNTMMFSPAGWGSISIIAED